MIRIKRSDVSRFEAFDPERSEGNYRRLHALAGGKLSLQTLSVFAQPKSADNGSVVEWYASVGGQPEAILDQPDAIRAAALKRLNERLLNVAKLADELEASSPDDAAFLRQAASYPDDRSVYLSNGQPILTDWGLQIVGLPGIFPDPVGDIPAAKTSTAKNEGTRTVPIKEGRWRARLPLWILLLLGLAALVAMLWWFFLRGDLSERLAAEIEAADCTALSRIAERPVWRRQADPTYQALEAHLAERLDDCEYERLRSAVMAAQGDCPALEALSADAFLYRSEARRVADLREEIADDLLDCRYAALRSVVGDGQCEAVGKALRADELRAPPEPRFAALREEALVVLSDCSYEAVAAAVDAADEDCPAMTVLLEDEVTLRQPPDPRFVTLRQRVDETLGECRYESVAAAVESTEDCEAMRQLIATTPELSAPPEPRYAALRQNAKEATLDCDLVRLAARIEEANTCKSAQTIIREEAVLLRAESPRLPPIRAALDKALAACRPPEERCPDERKPEQAPEFVLVLDASGSMEDAIGSPPDFYKTIDVIASIMLGTPAPQPNLGPSRMSLARSAASSVVSALPRDVSAGYVIVRDCPSAETIGFYSPSNRGQLLSRIKNTDTNGGTPLGDGVRRAGAMVNGIDKPAVILVVSDGRDSCDVNVCQIGQQLARTKPNLTINVVDIDGAGAGGCLATATGGEIFPARSAAEVARQMERAAEAALGPARCRRP